MDGRFAPAKKGGAAVGKTKRGKGTKWMALVIGGGVPLGVELAGANRAEFKLADATLCKARLGRKERHPKSADADRAYDSESLRRALRRRGIEPLLPARRKNVKKPPARTAAAAGAATAAWWCATHMT